jgi:hypothetical protein
MICNRKTEIHIFFNDANIQYLQLKNLLEKNK